MFSLSSLVLGWTLLRKPDGAFDQFGASVTSDGNDDVALLATLYGASILGEGWMQMQACRYPEIYYRPLLTFMIPYKLASAASLTFGPVLETRFVGRERELLCLAFCWLAPILLLAASEVSFGSPIPLERMKKI